MIKIICTTGQEKHSITAVLATRAARDDLPSVIIFKGKYTLKDIYLCCCVVTIQSWADETLMSEWIHVLLKANAKTDPTV